MTGKIGTLDLAVIAAYLLGIVAVGCYAGLKRRQEGEANRYFLAAHSLRWPSIGMALFATNISCLHLVSLAQAGYDSGLLMGNFEWMAGFTLVLLSLFFVPFYIRSKVATLPDFLEKRYCRECRDWLAVVSMVAAIVFHIAFPLSSGWIVLHGVFGIEKWTCILMICGLTALYTVLGGLAAVVMTETIQAIVLILGAVVITAFAYAKVGGWDADGPRLCRAPTRRFRLSVLRSAGGGKRVSLVRHLPGLSGAGNLVLVRRPDHRAARAGRQGREPRPDRPAVLRRDQDPAGVHLRSAGADLLRDPEERDVDRGEGRRTARKSTA